MEQQNIGKRKFDVLLRLRMGVSIDTPVFVV